MFFVYLLRSLRNGECYIGSTPDLRRRLCQHAAGETQTTRIRGPYELVYYEAYRHRDEAMVREQSLKKYPNVLRQLKRRLYRTMASSRSQKVVG